ncbi:lytic transglycosylase domain-containing protein [Flammeovirga sp. EKP202]|uniref:lytic transglycosylase domain-containing protein n=1 Tax=Flammeovirga sp. EKP202 TaxID=2770592 RepID=UPI00165FD9A3|nr:lytic transglycosylase domain-containing protein [Flammeovirga sp. EKP202]MBD0401708.1 lytic transglycosylase domain-containing protein [Flammeovirga sp. EKP202]
MKSFLWFLLGAISVALLTYAPQFVSPKSEVVTEKVIVKELEANSYELPMPESFSFCDEKVPLSDPDVYERFDRELYVNSYWHSHTILVLKRAERWIPRIEEILKEEGIPDDFKYLCIIESDLMLNARSSAGAAGFWQFMPSTAREYGLTVNKEVDERYNVEKATRAACVYLKKAKEKLGTWTLAAAAYNRGPSGIAKALKDQKVSSYYDLLLNEETSRYMFRILALKEIMLEPDKYSFELSTHQLYTEEAIKTMKIDTSIPDLASFAKEQGINYKILKRYNPWLRSNKLTIKRGKTYIITLPKVLG